MLFLTEADGVPPGLQVGVTAGGVTADWAIVSPVGARLEVGGWKNVKFVNLCLPSLTRLLILDSKLHLLIQILIALIQVFVLQAPLVLYVDVRVEFSCQRLAQL